MTKILRVLLFIIFLHTSTAIAQNTFKATIKDRETNEVLAGATAEVKGTKLGAISDLNGSLSISQIPDGKQVIQIRFIGYKTLLYPISFPLQIDLVADIFLDPELEEFEEVTISSTRSSRTIENIPTRVEFIAGEELEEKSNMKSGDIRMLLSESTGIQTQQTSATSANASIRIQGLDGRYTQLLKDGFPLFSGAASGLGLLQTPPLDLKQVEVIKGSASTLFGGGAIAGLVNLISKTPGDERELNMHINGTSGKGFDFNSFYGQKFDKIGTTIFLSHNRNGAYDPADIGLTAIPKVERTVINPKIFVFINKKTNFNLGFNTAFENRLGGDIRFINGDGDEKNSYFEKNETQRYSSQLSIDHLIDDKRFLKIKNSLSYFDRKISVPDFTFLGVQKATFSEISYTSSTNSIEWVAGLNLWTDTFEEALTSKASSRNYSLNTTGAFIQNLWNTTSWLNIETGLRLDHVFDYGWIILPRVNALFKFADALTSRIGGGFGYKAPTIFTEETERLQYRNVQSINNDENVLERSYGLNADLNYRTTMGDEVGLSINHLFFYTKLDHPLLLEQIPNSGYKLINSSGYSDTKGSETNLKLEVHEWKLFLGYTFTDAQLHVNGTSSKTTLTPKHRINTVLMYEVEEKWKLGLEAYYFGSQILSDQSKTKDYLITGFMIERLWEKFSVYLNFENFLDTRQTRFEPIYTGSISNPVFKDIYAPVDGFIINGGLKLKL
jgi:iron complex outermembrane receptor protein